MLSAIKISTSVGTSISNDGYEVDIRWAENIEKENRGFISNEMSVWIDGIHCGYLRVGFVPSENLKIFMPTVFHYMSSFGGSYFPELFTERDTFGKAIPFSDLPPEIFLKFSKNIAFLFRVDDVSWSTYEEMLTKLKKNTKYIDMLKEFKEFKQFHLDRPHVDYICTKQNTHNGILQNNNGRGLGLILYSATAHKLAEMNFLLHGSGIQSEDARKMWTKFETCGWVEYNEKTKRRWLNTIKMPRPENIMFEEKIAA